MKSKSTSQTANTYGYMAPVRTSQQDAYDKHVQTAYDTPDPSIGYTFGKSEQNLQDKFSNPWGFNYSPEVAEASMYAGRQDLNQARGQALREDAAQRRQAKTAGLAGSAGMAEHKLVQTGGSSSGTQSQPWGPALIGAGASLAGASLAGGALA